MAKLLYIESSPRKKRSSSIEVAKIFLKYYSEQNPQDEVVTIDLWQKELPPFDGNVIEAKYAILHGVQHSEVQIKAWEPVVNLINEFKSADKYLFSLPMWNFSIPYKLKHYIDLLVQPGLTFKYTAEKGFEGLVNNKKALLVYSRGGAYGPNVGNPELDLQKKYMESILGFIGLTNLQSVLIEPTLSSSEVKEKAVEKGTEEALRLARSF